MKPKSQGKKKAQEFREKEARESRQKGSPGVKAKGSPRVKLRRSLGITSHTSGSARKCEGV
jgi:hypothetical protein